MAVTDEKDKAKILHLFLDKVRRLQEIEEYFKGKYTYNEIRDVTREYYKNWGAKNGGK